MNNNKLKTLEGVYVPTLLTILGVIMYLRLGWVVGNAGVGGALLIIGIAHIITISTTLSMSSMLTNIKVGPGGAYSIISQSLGFQVGGAIGIPLYLSQAISVAFYIIGFTELWLSFFPNHSIALVAFVTWGVLAGLSITSAKIAFKVQYIILLVVVGSIFSLLAGGSLKELGFEYLGSFEEASFWQTFAIFFPAVTGILTGATMSGELKNPRKSIIYGTLGAVFTGLAVYTLVAVLFATRASSESLLSNNLVIMELSLFSPLIVLGIMGAVLSSALSTLVSAPRTLAALAENRTVPYYLWLSRKNKKGEPRNAIVFSSLLSVGVLLLGNLDGLANLLTLFFLTTYAMINLVVLVEKIIGIASFRPSFSVPLFVPVIGVVGCFFSMILINSFFVMIIFTVTIFIYYVLQKNKFRPVTDDVRGGIFHAIAEWAAQKAMNMPYNSKLWKPSIVVPVENPEDFKRITEFIKSLIYPSGRVYYLTINKGEKDENKIRDVLIPLKEERLFAHEVIIESGNFDTDFNVVLQTLASTFLAPNCIFITVSQELQKQNKLKEMFSKMTLSKMGLLFLHIHPKYYFGQNRNINLWLRDKSPNNNLAVLTAIQIANNWSAQISLCRIVSKSDELKKVRNELNIFIEDARLPVNTKIDIRCGKFDEIIPNVSTDLNILGLPRIDNERKFANVVRIMNLVPSSTLFVSDSGLEDALV